MPRPGPRPYECVRRAWHSDRHQPIRGSLIQEIFRIVNEIHGPVTKKNKEYQEKLPIVVLKAEEIMYSKASSEAEYMDINTLLDRTNDAIDTIIRREESTENGEFLQPCIEAALNLGCTPRRTTRSQRNSPRSYLGPSIQELLGVPVNIAENPAHGDHRPNSQYMSACSNFVAQKNDPTTHMLPFVSKGVPPVSKNQCLENHPAAELFIISPSYSGNHHRFNETYDGLKDLHKSVSNNFGHAKMDLVQNCLKLNGSDQASQSIIQDNPENPRTIGCDLSLRLGPVSMPCLNIKNGQLQESEHLCSCGSKEESKFTDQSLQNEKRFSFFPRADLCNPLDEFSSKWRFEGECMNLQSTARKRKGDLSYPEKTQKLCLQP
ncbi:Histone acetyltransferase [Quillaja saponaria]|uniref:Histone acetyltransferase n=1 Tax=Quillaja saponaria TaxID=32244 RepID=A0AAD7LXM0_QUISA|nr:Histone acetyltransferase [Quillaja saponaria]